MNVARLDERIGEEIGELCVLVLRESRNPRARTLAQRNRHGVRLLSLRDQWLQAGQRNPGGKTETLLRARLLDELRWRSVGSDDDAA